jgi:hypothetical protein
MSFTRTVPKSFEELQAYLKKIHDNRSHVRGVSVNTNNNHLEVTLDGMAHFAGNADVYLPIKKDKVNEAKLLVERMMTQSASGYPPSDTDARALYDMIDPMGK